MNFNIADLTLVILFGFFAIRGYMRGLAKELGAVAAILLGAYVAGKYGPEAVPYISPYVSGSYAGAAAYILVFTAVLALVWFVALGVSGLAQVTMTAWADRLFGGLFGLAKGVILAAALLYLVTLAAPNPPFLADSRLVPYLRRVSDLLSSQIPEEVKERLKEPLKSVPKTLPKTGQSKT